MNTRAPSHPPEQASTLVVTIIVVASILTLLGSAVAYTQHVSRMSDRSRRIAQAMEIGDGHLEFLFSNWRNISRAVALRNTKAQPATNFFFTSDYNPGPAPTPWTSPSPYPNPWPGVPPVIPRPSPANFANTPTYNVGQYRIQAVTPMIELDTNENSILSPSTFPPAAYGPNTWQFSHFYLAAVDITLPAMTGPVTAKVRRVFEKKFDNPWAFALFYNDDLELQPAYPLTIDGPVQTNNNLYIGTSNLTVQNSPITTRPPSKVSYGSDYVNGFSPNDPRSGGLATAPTFPADMPPSQESPYLPFGWNLRLQNADGSVNNDSYHELIERPVLTGGQTDPIQDVRFYNQAAYRIVITPGNPDTAAVTRSDGSNVTGGPLSKWIGNNGGGSSTNVLELGKILKDAREGDYVKVTNFNMDQLAISVNNGDFPGWNGVVYITDRGGATYNADRTVETAGTVASGTVNGNAYSTTKRAIRLINGSTLPSPSDGQSGYARDPLTNKTYKGVTIVSDNPVYIQGNYNTSGNHTYVNPLTNATTTYPHRPAAVIADAVTVLSGNWLDSNSYNTVASQRVANSTTVNTALVAGNVPSGGGYYSGGAENYIRFLEDWRSGPSVSFTYYGSMVQLYSSAQAIGRWNGNGSIYVAPATTRWYWDALFGDASPPGNLQIAAYLQQQRWYQVY